MSTTSDHAAAHEPVDLLIKSLPGARLFDARAGTVVPAPDIAFASGRIKVMAPGLPLESAHVVHCVTANQIICPGWTDIHTHYARHSPWGRGMEAAQHGLDRGVIRQVDAGTTGVYGFDSFRDDVLRAPATRGLVYALLNIAPAGLAARHRELRSADDFEELSAEETAAVARAHPGEILGIKVRLGWLQTSPEFWERALDEALRAAGWSKLPLMVHISDGPPADRILAKLRPGDIVTHCMHGRGPRPASLLADDGRHVRPAVKEARARGVRFDVGHGQGSFNVHTARTALDDGFLPDTISSDLHSGCVHGPTYDLPRTVSKMLSLGVTLTDALRMVTLTAVQAVGLPEAMGYLAEGAPGDCTVLEVVEPEGGMPFVDADGNRWRGTALVQPTFVVRDGAGR